MLLTTIGGWRWWVGQSSGGWAMAQRYASFLIRSWRMGAGLRRFTVSHIQSGEEARMESLPAAIAWIDARIAQEPAAEGSSGSDPPDDSPSNSDDDRSPAS